MEPLDLSVQLETSPGVFLELEDEVNGLTVEAGSFSQRDTELKTIEVGDDIPWFSGSLTLSSAPKNVTEALNVYVQGETPFDFATKVKTIETALEQVSFRIIRRVGDAQETWNCQSSTHTLSTQRELMHATLGIIQAQVKRLPVVTLEQV